MASSYEEIQYNIAKLSIARPKVDKEVPNHEGYQAYYGAESHFAAAGNITYLNEYIYPNLTPLFAERKHNLEFTILWGELKAIAATYKIAVERSKNREQRRLGGATQSRQAQRKWYLHWRHYYLVDLKQSVTKANMDFITVAWRIHNGDIPPPKGFCRSWFQNALGREKDKVVRSLPNFTKRALRHPDCNRLLESSATKIPIIPPIFFECYK